MSLPTPNQILSHFTRSSSFNTCAIHLNLLLILCTPWGPVIKFLTGYNKLKVYISLDDSVAWGVTLRGSSWIMRWHLHLQITSYDEKDFTVWLCLDGTRITWWLTTYKTAQCGSKGSLKNWTQIKSLLNQVYLNWIWDSVLDHTATSSFRFSFSYASSPFFLYYLLCCLLFSSTFLTFI